MPYPQQQYTQGQPPYTQGQPPYQQPTDPKRKKSVGFWVVLVIAIIAIVACGVLAYSLLAQPQTGTRDPNSGVGQLEGKTAEEIQAAIDQVVEDGMFNISITSVAEFEDGTSEGEIKIENAPNNPYLMQVDITRDDTGELVYQSGIIEQNHHIQSAKLSKDLDAGTYGCTAIFHALDPETEEYVGEAASKMTIVVHN